MRRSGLWWVGLFLVVAIAFAACGDDGGESGEPDTTSQPGGTAAPTTTKAPQVGGTLVWGEYTEPAGLDPLVALGQGTSGGIELAAIYDTIMRYNPETGKYETRTAESLNSNADFTEWTLKLKPNIKFTDGTDYDAAAVVFGLNRHRSGTAGAPACETVVACPRNGTSSGVYMALVKDVQAVDKLTVKITLNEAWSAFPYALASEPSMIPSPTALKKCDAAKNPNTCDFNLKPVGAGPFMVDSFKPKDSINMVRNPGYWGGQVYLDGLRFINIGDAGGLKTVDALKSGTLHGAFLRDPQGTAGAHEAKMTGTTTMEAGGGIFLLNMGVAISCVGGKPEPLCVGKPDGQVTTSPPTKDLKVRQAIAAATDVKQINDRATNGKGLAGSQLLQNDFRWYPDVAGPKYDLDTAKRLVQEAKSAGWDGKLRLLFNNTPFGQSVGLTLQTMLQLAGIDAQLDTSKSTTDMSLQVTTQKDFDLAGWGIALSPDDGAMAGLAQNFSSTSPTNRVGYKNAVVDQALKDIRAAKTDDDKKAAYKKIAEAIHTDLPIVVWSKIEEFNTWSAKVHGIVPMGRAIVLFHQAWIEK
ncbi:MAG TPA: ABC transporter substrate-binding protein [Acidimicrobiales bacterium]|jgi:peptide/nickel transport system substrate-binding protein|nr:ABC transporter substrate-binding protein [Acidimicrobiales bacterium]